MAHTRPVAVVIIASRIPPARKVISAAVPRASIWEKAFIRPVIVPKRPKRGATVPINEKQTSPCSISRLIRAPSRSIISESSRSVLSALCAITRAMRYRGLRFSRSVRFSERAAKDLSSSTCRNRLCRQRVRKNQTSRPEQSARVKRYSPRITAFTGPPARIKLIKTASFSMPCSVSPARTVSFFRGVP